MLGCRNIHELPESVERMLGDYICNFFYEVDTIGGQPRTNDGVYVDSQIVPSPKRVIYENSNSVNPGDSNIDLSGNTSQSDSKGENPIPFHTCSF